VNKVSSIFYSSSIVALTVTLISLSVSSHGLVPENSNSLLNACIGRVLGPQNYSMWSNVHDPTTNLQGALGELKDSTHVSIDNTITEVFQEIGSSAVLIADSCTYTPKQFWKVADLFAYAISTAPSTCKAFSSIIESFETIGKWIVRKDPKSSIALFFDFAMLKLSGVLTSNPMKRKGVLRVMYGFSPVEISSHLTCIKRLQTIVTNIPDFIFCLAVIVSLETEIDPTLLELFMYYAMIGLSSPSPKLRAASLYMLAMLLPLPITGTADITLNLLPLLTRCSQEENWWESQGHMLSLCGALFTTFSQGGPSTESRDSEILNGVLNIVRNLLSPKFTRTIKMIGVSKLAAAVKLPNESKVYDDLSIIFLTVLCSLEKADRSFLLSISHFTPYSLPTSCGIPFIVEPVALKWSPIAVARVIKSRILDSSNDRMEPAQLHILAGAVATAYRRKRASSLENDQFWIELFTSLKDAIYDSICDPECCEYAAEILKTYVCHSPLSGTAVRDSKFLVRLRILYPTDGSGSKFCQKMIESMLKEIYSADAANERIVLEVLDQFARTYAAQFSSSSLSRLSKELA
jgi:hypothetical protein